MYVPRELWKGQGKIHFLCVCTIYRVHTKQMRNTCTNIEFYSKLSLFIQQRIIAGMFTVQVKETSMLVYRCLFKWATSMLFTCTCKCLYSVVGKKSEIMIFWRAFPHHFTRARIEKETFYRWETAWCSHFVFSLHGHNFLTIKGRSLILS